MMGEPFPDTFFWNGWADFKDEVKCGVTGWLVGMAVGYAAALPFSVMVGPHLKNLLFSIAYESHEHRLARKLEHAATHKAEVHGRVNMRSLRRRSRR